MARIVFKSFRAINYLWLFHPSPSLVAVNNKNVFKKMAPGLLPVRLHHKRKSE